MKATENTLHGHEQAVNADLPVAELAAIARLSAKCFHRRRQQGLINTPVSTVAWAAFLDQIAGILGTLVAPDSMGSTSLRCRTSCTTRRRATSGAAEPIG